MRRLLLSLSLLMLVTASASPLIAAVAASPADASILSLPLSIDGETLIPGAVLKSGNYVIRVVDHMSDRSIIRVEKTDGKTVSIFLGVPNQALAEAGGPGPVAWSGGSTHEKALRGYNFPGKFSVEFVYPKAEAVKIATSHSVSVEAIDPESDNLSSKEKNLSAEDMRIVTLWTLTPTRVDNVAGIAAQKYVPAALPSTSNTVVARNEPPAVLPARTRPTPVAPAQPTKAAASSTKPIARRPITTALPHTASSLPLVLLAGIVSLLGLVTLRTRERLLGR